ncbi:21 kDa seed protein-like [Pistacia vera]|uniref:21 kDa seed protein-like n=1 Tax=Pistacia vera TaxID=55513 RepID=UPI0012638031|nr:21 kDa seed protein-like [Pistacia vera]
MKIPLLAISFLVFAFIAKSIQGLPKNNEPVLDSTGEKVVTSADYFLLPAIPTPGGGGGGGLNLFAGKNMTCPLINVIQEHFDLLKGLPMKFSNAKEEEGVVYASTDINIKFSAAESLCSQETVWKVNDYDKRTGQWFITNDGVAGNPGVETLENWFKIEKVGLNVYKLAHCPSVCASCVTLCSGVGFYPIDGIRRLALSRFPLAVMLVKRYFNATD